MRRKKTYASINIDEYTLNINKCIYKREIHRKEIQEKQEKHLPHGGGHRLPEAQHEVRREGDPRVVQVRLTLCTAFTISVVKKNIAIN